jgi:hypothetical protein
MGVHERQHSSHGASGASLSHGQRMSHGNLAESFTNRPHVFTQHVRVQRGSHHLHSSGSNSNFAQSAGIGHGVKHRATGALNLRVGRVCAQRLKNGTHAGSCVCANHLIFARVTPRGAEQKTKHELQRTVKWG